MSYYQSNYNQPIHDQFKINSLLLVETGTYNDQTLRPYLVNATPQNVQQLAEVTHFGQNFAPSNIAGTAGQILVPSTNIDGIIQIPNGWGETRFRFLMEVEVSAPLANNITYILTGYTDRTDPSFTGALDPNLQFYINNVITMRKTVEMTDYGAVERLSLADASHVLYDPSGNDLHSMRPEDLFSTLGVSHYTGRSDLRTNFAIGAKLSRRNNGLAANYLSRALEAQRIAIDADDGMGDMRSLMNSAKGNVQEQSISSSMPLFILRSRTGWQETNYVTLAELENLSPGMLEHATDIQYRNTLPYLAHQGDSEYFVGSNVEDIIYSTLSQAVPAIMMDCIITSLYFNVTNDTFGGRPDFNWGTTYGFANIDLSQHQEIFANRFLTEIYPDLTRFNQRVVSIEATVDIRGDSIYQISVDGQPFVQYIIPTFADGLMPPVITVNEDHLSGVANGISYLSDSLSASY